MTKMTAAHLSAVNKASGHRLVQEDNSGARIMGETILHHPDDAPQSGQGVGDRVQTEVKPFAPFDGYSSALSFFRRSVPLQAYRMQTASTKRSLLRLAILGRKLPPFNSRNAQRQLIELRQRRPPISRPVWHQEIAALCAQALTLTTQERQDDD